MKSRVTIPRASDVIGLPPVAAFNMLKRLLLWLCLLTLLPVTPLRAGDGIFARENLAAWCIVPFDAKHRGPEERAAMLEKLGLTKFIYDYRAEHIPQWDAELEALKKHHISLTGWWFPTTLNDEAKQTLTLFRRHGVSPQLWVMGDGGPVEVKDEADRLTRIKNEATRLQPIAEAAAAQGCKVGLYNHGSWFGEPENAMAIVDELRQRGVKNVGLVYNLHHGHSHLDRLEKLLPRMVPYLLCFNLNGMDPVGEPTGRKILPLGAGSADVKVLRLLRASNYQGMVGILNHTDEDAEGRLQDNLDGLAWLLPQLDGHPAAPRPAYRTWQENPPAAPGPDTAPRPGAAPAPAPAPALPTPPPASATKGG
ncbi:MAG: Xylose isomerase-like barrel [Verrucomicrobiales bacterium]|nr:Xylose isomerase-like barrel [Verrucomicrobiales bacterium]